MSDKRRVTHRLKRSSSPSLRNWQKPAGPAAEVMESNVALDMGWGRLIFGHTFDSSEELAEVLRGEQEGQRDIALYLRDPHVVLSLAPAELFLDPSHTYRLWSHVYRPAAPRETGFVIRRLKTVADAEAVNRIYAARHMVTCDPQFMVDEYATRLRTYLVAESGDGNIVGTVTGVDHAEAFSDPENGSSLWCLAVDPQAAVPGVGEALVRQLVEHYFARTRDYVDLSVLHNNRQAIELYEKLGFQRVPVFCVKHKNPINESLFIAPQPHADLNPYAKIIIDEARRRGIRVDVLDEEFAYFRLSLGGSSIVCRESLTELTSAIAFSRCDDKRLTHRVLRKVDLKVPEQLSAGEEPADHLAFLERHERVVVKPARGEQGAGVSVDIRIPEELERAVRAASEECEDVIIEEYVSGQDLRVIVIDNDVVAAAVRKPPRIKGTGEHSINELLDKYNRRRMAATGGESRVPLDDETKRCVRLAGYDMDSILPPGESVTVRRTANLHTGGTIHDVTNEIHPSLSAASVAAARALDIPVVGLDLAVPDLHRPDYHIIEANERPGLANHEPQPTAERFIDLLFPQTVADRPQTAPSRT